jgi:hypothetical protein
MIIKKWIFFHTYEDKIINKNVWHFLAVLNSYIKQNVMLPDESICWSIYKDITRFELALDRKNYSEAQKIGQNLMDRSKIYPELATILGLENIAITIHDNK